MSFLDFKGKAQADAWKADLEDLNAQLDAVLHNMGNCIEEINLESEGDHVDALMTTSAIVIDEAAKVIEGMEGLVTAIQDVINALIQFVADAVQDVYDDQAKATNL